MHKTSCWIVKCDKTKWMFMWDNWVSFNLFITSFGNIYINKACEFIGEINYIIICIYTPPVGNTLMYHSIGEMHPRENVAILHGKIHE